MDTLDWFYYLFDKIGVDKTIKMAMDMGIEIPSPVGYGPVSMASNINVWSPWNDHKAYLENTMLNKYKLYVIRSLASIAPNNVSAELGVYNGGVTRMLLDMDHIVYAFDTFNGIAGSGGEDLHKDGEFMSPEDVFDYTHGAIHIIGELPGTLRNLEKSGITDRFGFVHFDLDVYTPTADSLDIIYHGLLADGGIIVFDDYGGWTTQGVKKAVDEFEHGRKLYLPTGQMVIFK